MPHTHATLAACSAAATQTHSNTQTEIHLVEHLPSMLHTNKPISSIWTDSGVEGEGRETRRKGSSRSDSFFGDLLI